MFNSPEACGEAIDDDGIVSVFWDPYEFITQPNIDPETRAELEFFKDLGFFDRGFIVTHTDPNNKDADPIIEFLFSSRD